MKIILEGNAQVSIGNSQTVNSNANIRVKKDSPFHINKYTYGYIDGKHSKSTLTLSHSYSNHEFIKSSEYADMNVKKIEESLYDDDAKKMILDNIGALSDTLYLRNYNPMITRNACTNLIRNYSQMDINMVGCVLDTTLKHNNTIKMLREVNGTKFFGTNPKNILFGIKDGKVVYQRYISENVWIDDDDGGYSTDIYCINNLVINKDNSAVSRKVEQYVDYDTLVYREQLWNLPDSLKEFRLPFFLSSTLRKDALENYVKIDCGYNNEDMKDIIGDYKIYEKEKAISFNTEFRQSVYVMMFNNITEEVEWKKKLAKVYRKDINYLQNSVSEKYKIEDVFHFRDILTITKDGNRFIMNTYSAQRDRRWFISNDDAIVHSFSPNLEPLIPHVIYKTLKEVYDVKSKVLSVENSKIVTLSKDGVAIATYEKILVNEEIKYVLQSIEYNDDMYQVSSPSKSAPTTAVGNGRFITQQAPIDSTYHDYVFVFKHKKDSKFRVGLADTSMSVILPISKFTFDKPAEDVNINFKDITFKDITDEWEVPGSEYIPHGIYDDSGYLHGNKERNELLWKDEKQSYTYILNDRPQKLVDSFINSKQQVVIDMDSLVNKKYTNCGPKINMLYKPGEVYPFIIVTEHKYTFGELTLKIEVRNTFIYYPNKMDVEALQYYSSETTSVEYECNIDTTKTLDFSRYVNGIANISYVTIDTVNNLVVSFKEYEDLVNNYLNKLSKNTTEQEEETLFEEDEINKLLFIMSSFNDVLFK